MKRFFILTYLSLYCGVLAFSQDTTVVQTLTFDSTGRDYVFAFPEDLGQQYRKILMHYRMRCKDGLVSTGADRNKGCGEWDYSCNTYITDSTQTDSIKATHPDYIISNFSGSSYDYTSSPMRFQRISHLIKRIGELTTREQLSI